MVHNGIEYGIMAAYAEGLNILHHANVGKTARESMPKRRRCAIPSITNMTSNLADVTEVWRRGSVVASWLLDLTAISLLDHTRLREILGTGFRFRRRALDYYGGDRRRAPVPVLSAALFQRFDSRGEAILPTSCSRRCASNLAATSSARRAAEVICPRQIRRRI